MSVIRRYSSEMDSASNCEGCFRQRPEIVVEDYPSAGNQPTFLCYRCAVRSLEENTDLLAHAVLSMILGPNRLLKN